MSVADRLRDVRVPGEDDARERAQRLVHAAFEERAPRGRRPVPRPRLAPALAAALLALVVLALTPPGKAVSDWIRDRIAAEPAREPESPPALAKLPAPGRLLVDSPAGTWVVASDGSKRLLGPWRDPSWSPQGLFVVAARSGGLVAAEPGGRVRWTLARPRVAEPRWAPSGIRVAYRSGASIRVVAGDGTDDRRLGPGVAAEWRPGRGANVLAVARRGSVAVVDVESGRTLSRESVRGARGLAWSADGRTLAVLARDGRVTLIEGARSRRLPVRASALAYAPRGRALALVRRRPGRSELLLHDGRTRLLFGGRGRLGAVTWSPDGRWLLASQPGADQWLFVRVRGTARVKAVAGVAREFGPRASSPGPPVPRGWSP
jgi:dipeptidyl aminopeptidase/acylaminoacyl peptidase